MILLDAILRSAINPALGMLPVKMDTDAARVQILAVGLQESRLKFRQQKTSDPYRFGLANGLWQTERPTVGLVLTNVRTEQHALDLCRLRKVPPDSSLVWSALPHDDILAAGFARLLLWADPKPLPDVDADHETAWQCYLRCWRPGKPRRETWDEFHAQARAQVMA